jgi:hypothetical protein
VEAVSDRPAWDESDEISMELARLRNAVACELHAQLALRGETIILADVPKVALAVAAQLGHAFRITWAPQWESDRDDDDSLGWTAPCSTGRPSRTDATRGHPTGTQSLITDGPPPVMP